MQIWPDLRETFDTAQCNKGLPRAELQAKLPQFDFSECAEEWDYPPYSFEGAMVRAERVRRRLEGLSARYRNIAVVSHRGFIAFLVKGMRFDVCEVRSYRFATDAERLNEKIRMGINCDTLGEQDFGPTALIIQRGQILGSEG